MAGDGGPSDIFVFYTVSGCKGEDATHPNAYPLGLPGVKRSGGQTDVRLKDILMTFPLPGNFHFRFRVNPPAGLTG